MNRTLSLAAISCAALLALTGCAMSSTPSTASAPNAAPATTAATPPVPEQLRDMDIAANVDVQPQSAYNTAFAALSKDCTEQGVPLANEVHATLGLLQKAKITDETHLTVMQHIAQSIPAGSPKMSCADIAGAYVTLREGQ